MSEKIDRREFLQTGAATLAATAAPAGAQLSSRRRSL